MTFIEGGFYMKCLKPLCGLVFLFITALFILPNLNILTPAAIQGFLLEFGLFAPLIYIVLFTLVPLTLFPDAVLAIASGLVFGTFYGFTYTMIGALCGGTLAFFIARFFCKDLIMDKLSKHISITSAIENNGFAMILTLRLIPLIPFDIISYCSGATGVNYKDFILATVLGIIPGIFLLVNIGAGMNELNSPRLYLSATAFVLLITVAKIFKTKLIPQ